MKPVLSLLALFALAAHASADTVDWDSSGWATDPR